MSVIANYSKYTSGVMKNTRNTITDIIDEITFANRFTLSITYVKHGV